MQKNSFILNTDFYCRMSRLLVSNFPLGTGIGTYSYNLNNLGFFDRHALLKINNTDKENGFTDVFKYRFNPHGLRNYASLFIRTSFSDFVKQFDHVHFSSVNSFHFSKFQGNSTGTLHDFFPIEDKISRAPYSKAYVHYFKKELSYMKNLKGIIVNSNTVHDKLKTIYPDLEARVIHLWTSKDFTYRNKIEARTILGLPVDKKILLNVSSAQPRKNITFLPRLMKHLNDDFLLVRIGPSEEIRNSFSSGKFITYNVINPTIYPLFFNAADLLIDPSLNEGFGIPIIEAINSDLTVIASKIPIFAEILGENYTYLAEVNDKDRWIESIKEAVQERSPYYLNIKNYYVENRAFEEYAHYFESIFPLK